MLVRNNYIYSGNISYLMAKHKEHKEEPGKLNCDPLVVFQDMRNLIFEKYPNIKIAELELALAWFLMDLDITVSTIAPESQNVSIYEAVDKMLFVTDGCRNTIVRILNDVQLLNNEIEKAKKKQQKKNDA